VGPSHGAAAAGPPIPTIAAAAAIAQALTPTAPRWIFTMRMFLFSNEGLVRVLDHTSQTKQYDNRDHPKPSRPE
jgi:hypothetical protein